MPASGQHPRLFDDVPRGSGVQPAWGSCGGRACAEPLPAEAYAQPEYPMYVLPVKALLEMDAMRPHQELLRDGLLQEWEPAMEGRVVFVSHQWLGYQHPDPGNQQFSTLRRLLRRLADGLVDTVEAHWMQQVIFQTNRVIEAHRWKAALPHMYLWIDFTCIPQPGYGDGSSSHEITRSPSVPELAVRRRASSGLACHAASEGAHHHAGSDHRFHTNSEVAESLTKAVNSIPTYVERCCLLLVLVPACAHADRPEICNYSSWRSRGWCRMELVAALLARHAIRVMVCPGALASPYFLFPADGLLLPACDGKFTCCARGHLIDGQHVACDKQKVTAVVRTMLQSKVRQLARQGQTIDSRFLSCVRHRFLAGFGGAAMATISEHPVGREAVERLKRKLDWHSPEDDSEARRSGWTLLYYATIADDANAVKELLAGDAKAAGLNLPLRRGEPLLTVPDGMTPVLSAMAYARPSIVEDLLNAEADPCAVTTGATGGLDALSLAATLGRVENVAFWLRRFPDWDLEQAGKVAGQTAVHKAATVRHHSMPVIRMLLEAGASFLHTDFMGNTVLHSITNKDDEDLEGVALLLEKRADLNGQVQPSTGYWRLLLKGSRLAVRMGARRQIVQEMARWEGSTALSHAAVHGNIALVRDLLQARADPQIRNRQGRTALESARAAFGDEAPLVLEALLEDVSGKKCCKGRDPAAIFKRFATSVSAHPKHSWQFGKT